MIKLRPLLTFASFWCLSHLCSIILVSGQYNLYMQAHMYLTAKGRWSFLKRTLEASVRVYLFAFYNFSDDSIWIIDFVAHCHCWGAVGEKLTEKTRHSYGLTKLLDFPCFSKSERFRNFKFEIALFMYLDDLKIKLSSLSN